MAITITFNQQQYVAEENKTVLQVMQMHGVALEQPCGGYGKCGKCKVRLVSGNLAPLTNEEKLLLSPADIQQNFRLACMAKIVKECALQQPQNISGKEVILTEGELPTIRLAPLLSKSVFNTEQFASFQKNKLANSDTPFKQDDQNFPTLTNELVTVVFYDGKIMGLEQRDTFNKLYGIALDIGTTTVVGSLVDLNIGKVIATQSCINPQKNEGLDVLSRITFAHNAENLLKLNTLILECIGQLVDQLCVEANISALHIYEIVVAANTTMLHLLLNVDPTPLGKFPYTPAFTHAQTVAASQLGIKISPFGQLYTLPVVSGFIGGDIVSGALLTSLKEKQSTLFIDIGTNGEMILAQNGKLTACSCAAGPALEGMNISMGMRAAPGAIDYVGIHADDINLSTIADLPAQGICGSGIISAIATFVDAGIIAPSGRIQALSSHVIDDERNRKICLCTDPQTITISQEDVRQVQLAKAALRAGILALLDAHSLTPEALNEVIIAGQFGRYLTVDSLTGVGIIPVELQDKIRYVGNASKNGALICLLSGSARIEACALAEQINYQELSAQKDFNQRFVDCLRFS